MGVKALSTKHTHTTQHRQTHTMEPSRDPCHATNELMNLLKLLWLYAMKLSICLWGLRGEEVGVKWEVRRTRWLKWVSPNTGQKSIYVVTRTRGGAMLSQWALEREREPQGNGKDWGKQKGGGGGWRRVCTLLESNVLVLVAQAVEV